MKHQITAIAHCLIGGVTFTLTDRDGVLFVVCPKGARLADIEFIRQALRSTMSVAVMDMLLLGAFDDNENNVLTEDEFTAGVSPGLTVRENLRLYLDTAVASKIATTPETSGLMKASNVHAALSRVLGDNQ